MSTDVFFPYAITPAKVGRPTNFVFEEPDTLVENQPNPYLKAQYAIADPYETEINNCPQMTESSTNTEQVDVATKGQLHIDGGWPTSVDVNEPEERNKYARRLCRDERHVEVLKVLVPQLSSCLRANAALDIYEPLFEKTRFAMPAKDEAEAEERSKRLCPWRHNATTTAGEVVISDSNEANHTTTTQLAIGTEITAIHHLPASSASAKPKMRSDEIAYSDPSVVHSLHVSCKLSIPVLDDGKPVHGTTASQSRFTCGSDSTTLVVGYCEGILPSKVDVAGASVAGGSNSVRGGDLFGATVRNNSRLSAYDSINNQLGLTPNFFGSPTNAAGGRRSTAVSPSYLSNQRRRSTTTPGGADDAGDNPDLGASLRNTSQSAAFILKEKGEDDDDDEDDLTAIPTISITTGGGDEKAASGAHQHASNSLLSDAQRATNNLKRQQSNLAAMSGTFSLSPLRPAPTSEWGCAGAMWSITDPSAHTNLFMSCNGGATSIVASYRDPNVVHGGMSSGVLEWWDIRQGSNPVAASGRDHSHRDAVTCVKLVTTKATECFSCGLDGQVLFWDTRRLATPIFEETVLLRDPRTGATWAATGIDFDPLVGGTLKYLVSTIEGKVVSCGRRANKSGEKILNVFDAHYGACFSAMRCPAVPKIFATCGDWGFKLFGDELKSASIYTSPLVKSHVLCGTWHPTRHSIFILGTSSGDVYFYDILRTAHAAVMKIRASSCAIRHLEVHVSGQSIAATDINGEVHIVTLPSALYEPTLNERQNVVAALEREYNRERVSDGIESANPFVDLGIRTSASYSSLRIENESRGTSSWPQVKGGEAVATAEGSSMFMGAITNADRNQTTNPSPASAAPLLVSLTKNKVGGDEDFSQSDGNDQHQNTDDEDQYERTGSDFGATHNRVEGSSSKRTSPSPQNARGWEQNASSSTATTISPQPSTAVSLAEAYLNLVGVTGSVNPYSAPAAAIGIQPPADISGPPKKPEEQFSVAKENTQLSSYHRGSSSLGSGLFSRLKTAAALSNTTVTGPPTNIVAKSTSGDLLTVNAAEAHLKQRERRVSSATNLTHSFSGSPPQL